VVRAGNIFSARVFDPAQTRGIIGKGELAGGSYYYEGDDRDTVSFLVAGLTDHLEIAVNQYYQGSDWTLSGRYGIIRESEPWWHPSLVVGAHDIGRPEDAALSLTGFKYLEAPYLKGLSVHAGIFTETGSGGDTRGFGGFSKAFGKWFDFSLLYDGEDPHAILGTNYQGVRVFVMAYEMDHFGVGLSYQFDLLNTL
jgi:hypothetical protein